MVEPTKFPPERQFGCLYLGRDDAWSLRELIKPFEAPPQRTEETINFLLRLYELILRMYVEDHEFYGMTVSVEDCLLINQVVKSGAWNGADAVLLQTFQVIHEHTHSQPFRDARLIAWGFAFSEPSSTQSNEGVST